MKKNLKKYIYIILIVIFSLIIFLLAYNSFINLSYVRKKYDKYTFMLPKEIEYIQEHNRGILKHDKILISSVEVYNETYDLSKDVAQTYTFYESNVEIVSEDEEKIGNNNLYVVTKKIKYFDNNKTTYMLTYIYDISESKQFVISVECKNLDDIKYFIKKLKRTAKSIILY